MDGRPNEAPDDTRTDITDDRVDYDGAAGGVGSGDGCSKLGDHVSVAMTRIDGAMLEYAVNTHAGALTITRSCDDR